MSVTKEDRVVKRWANYGLSLNKYTLLVSKVLKRCSKILVITYILVTSFRNSNVENVIKKSYMSITKDD